MREILLIQPAIKPFEVDRLEWNAFSDGERQEEVNLAVAEDITGYEVVDQKIARSNQKIVDDALKLAREFTL